MQDTRLKVMVLMAYREILNGVVVGAGRQVQTLARTVSTVCPVYAPFNSEKSQSFSAAMLQTPAKDDAVALISLTKSQGKTSSED